MRLGLTKVGSYVVEAVLGGDCTKTALICFQVLKAAIYQIGEFRKANNGGKING